MADSILEAERRQAGHLTLQRVDFELTSLSYSRQKLPNPEPLWPSSSQRKSPESCQDGWGGKCPNGYKYFQPILTFSGPPHTPIFTSIWHLQFLSLSRVLQCDLACFLFSQIPLPPLFRLGFQSSPLCYVGYHLLSLICFQNLSSLNSCCLLSCTLSLWFYAFKIKFYRENTQNKFDSVEMQPSHFFKNILLIITYIILKCTNLSL